MFILDALDRFDHDIKVGRYAKPTDPFDLYNVVSLAARHYWNVLEPGRRFDRNLFVGAILQREYTLHLRHWYDSDWEVIMRAFFGVAGDKILQAWQDAIVCEFLWAISETESEWFNAALNSKGIETEI